MYVVYLYAYIYMCISICKVFINTNFQINAQNLQALPRGDVILPTSDKSKTITINIRDAFVAKSG